MAGNHPPVLNFHTQMTDIKPTNREIGNFQDIAHLMLPLAVHYHMQSLLHMDSDPKINHQDTKLLTIRHRRLCPRQ